MALESIQLKKHRQPICLEFNYRFIVNLFCCSHSILICEALGSVQYFLTNIVHGQLILLLFYTYHSDCMTCLRLPVHSYGIVVVVLYLSYESFLVLFPKISSLQFSESCLIYGSLLHVQATVVLFFTLLQYQPTVFLLSYVSCLQLSNCCCSRTSYI
jgi:hypothetical protein